MNLVLADTEEFRRTKRKSKPAAGPSNAPLVEAEEKRTLGLTIVRGTQVVSCSVDGPPPADPSARLGTAGPGVGAASTLAAGPGISKPAGRGLPIGLGGPAAGVGGPPPPGGFPGFPPGGFPGAPPPGFGGRGGPPGGPRKSLDVSKSLLIWANMTPLQPALPLLALLPKALLVRSCTVTSHLMDKLTSLPAGAFQPPPGFQPPGQGRGYPPPGFGGR